MTRSKIGIIISTTRQGRFADRPTQWLLDIARARNDADYEIVDLRDEFVLPGQLVADATITAVDHRFVAMERLEVTAVLLLLEEG